MKLVGLLAFILTKTTASSTNACHEYCQEVVGSSSYCKMDQSPRVCHGTEVPCCMNGVTAAPELRVSAASAFRVTAECEQYPSSPTAPMFLWVEEPKLSRSDFEEFFARIAAYITGNCVRMQTVRLVLRVGSPYTKSQDDSSLLYWPPESSLIHTVLMQRLREAGEDYRIQLVFYPYIFENDSRGEWVRFGLDRSLNNRRNNRVNRHTVYDGIYSFVHGWQEFANSNPSSSIFVEGYTIDYEEIDPTKRKGAEDLVDFEQYELAPYVAAYPHIRSGLSLGYDDKKRIRHYSGYMDNIYLQVYDLYYPYKHADRSLEDSIFVNYNSNPRKLSQIILEEVLKPEILSIYRGREDRLFLMWSTQYISERKCLYPIGEMKSCGINYEIHSTPANFNEFINRVSAGHEILSRVQHGVYTFNFLQESWMPRSSRH